MKIKVETFIPDAYPTAKTIIVERMLDKEKAYTEPIIVRVLDKDDIEELTR